MLLRSNLQPIGVSVSLSSPKRQSRDLLFWRFCINSKETIVERSIIIEPWDGSNLIRREWKANDLQSWSSTYFRTSRKMSSGIDKAAEVDLPQPDSTQQSSDHPRRLGWTRFPRESKHFHIIMGSSLRPIPAINAGDCELWKIPLNDTVKLRLGGSVHEDELTGLKHPDLVDGLHIRLAVTDLTEYSF